MITDNKQTGVPNRDAFKTQGIAQRTNLVKPIQANNFGSSAPSSSVASNPLVPPNNTMSPMSTPQTARGAQPVAPPQTPAPSPSPALEKPATPSIFSTPMSAQTPSVSSIDSARDLIRGLSDNDLMTILNELANGGLRGNGRA